MCIRDSASDLQAPGSHDGMAARLPPSCPTSRTTTCSPDPSPASASTSRGAKATRAARSAARRAMSAERGPAVSTKQCSAASA
eukprot:14997514-Alexandrium_andersonii.AAC.1